MSVPPRLAMSAELQWAIIRKSSSFIVKSLGTTLSREPNNISSRNSFKANGLVNKNVVGIKAADKGVILSTRSKGKLVNTTLSRGGRRAIKSIRSATAGCHYRADLTDSAIRKASAVIRSQKNKSVAKRRSRKYKN